MRRHIIASSVAVVLLALAPSLSRAATLAVPSTYPTIQAGLAAAVSGDVVELACGTYYEHNLVLPPGVVLRSESGDPACAVIESEGGPWTSGILSCDHPAAGTALKGLTFRGGVGVTGCAISVFGGTLLIADCVLEDNGPAVQDAGALDASMGASLVLERCVFQRNECAGRGGAMLLTEGTTADVVDCGFRDNVSSSDGAISVDHSSIHLVRTLLAGNETDGPGAAIRAGSSVVEAIDCVFEGNVAGDQGGAIAAFASTLQATGTRFVGNAGNFGGAVIGGGGAVIGLEDCLFAGNSATIEGAALYLQSSSDATLSGCTLARNTDPFDGCVIHARESTVALSHTIIADNDAVRATQCAVAGIVTAACTNIFGNTAGNGNGDWTSCQVGQLGLDGNISTDPLFCDPDAGDFTLRADSPCAEANSGGCGRIGALDVGCESATAAGEPTVTESWGLVKGRYRDDAGR